MKPRHTRIGAYALIVEADRLLLCRLSKQVPRWEGYWTLPGGGVEFGEPPEDAMIREVAEETGLQVEPLSVAAVDSFVDFKGAEDFHGIRILYRVKVTGGELRNEVSGSTDACAWHSFATFPKLELVPLAELGLRLVRQQERR